MSPRKNSLLPIVRSYFETDLPRAAHSLESLPTQEAVEVLSSIPASLAAQAMPHLQVEFAASLLKNMPSALSALIAGHLEPALGASVFLRLPEDKKEEFLNQLTEKAKREVRDFLNYPEDSAGRIMSTDAMTFRTDITVREAISKIRQSARQKTPASYAYVLDRENHLVGVMNMRDMLMAPAEARLESVMRRDIFSIQAFTDREQIARELSKRRFFAVPVVDAQNRFLGVIRAEQMIQDVQEEATEDLQKMFGAGGDERVFSPLGFSMRMRLPWLHINLATAFLAAATVALFESLIARITILAVFLPVVAGQGGNAGAQSLAVVMRGLVMREIPQKKVFKLLAKETGLGLMNGIIIGVVTGAVTWAWHGNPYLGLVLTFSMIVNMAVAGLAGALIPIAMKSVGLDPAQCSNIILTTITDVMGIFSFLGFAVLFQNYLV
ncbi:MAG: magnesium transporter [Candidatus Omnitrophica bacterium]|nr:magnesium transporter [Candidatus Omnitrophota bacterium]